MSGNERERMTVLVGVREAELTLVPPAVGALAAEILTRGESRQPFAKHFDQIGRAHV